MNKTKGKIRRLLGSFWNGISALRRLVGNLLFLTVVILLIVLAFSGDREDVPDGAALILSPEGDIVEEKSETVMALDILGEATGGETRLRDLIDVIDFAAEDDRIEVMVLDLRNMGAVGISKLQAIGAALERFKNSGKPVFAFGDYYNQRQYYLAAHADRLHMNPMGGVMLHGFGLYRKYYKTAIDKLRIQVHAFKVGTYKSALEPFLRDSMSAYAKEANLAWLSVLWDFYKADVAGQRGLAPQDLDDYINDIPSHLERAGGDPAVAALNLGLVDELKTRQEVRQELIATVGEDEDGITYRQIGFDDYFRRIRPRLTQKPAGDNRVGIIVASGIIMEGEQPAGRIGSETMIDLLARARRDESIKAVVVRIDSGGGSANASEAIRREIELTRQAGKPVYVSMGSVAASGGYWIASSAEQIWATPTTITGSIGIFGAFPTFEKSLQSLGINSDGVGTTKLSDAFDPSRPLNERVAESMRQIIEHGYQHFVQRVAAGRNMKPEAVEKIAQGRVWAGTTAKELGLVDKIGDLQDAVEAVAERADLKDYEITYITRTLTPRQRLIERLSQLIGGIRIALNPAAYPDKRWYDHLIDTEIDLILRAGDPAGLYAYCLNCSRQ